MGCFCSCFRVPEQEESAQVVVSDNRNRTPFSYLTQIIENTYGVLSGNAGLRVVPSSAQGTDIAATEVGINTPQDTLLANSSSSGDLELQQHVAVAGNNTGFRALQLEHGPHEGHNVQVKRPYIATPEVGTNAPQGTLLPKSLRSRNPDLQGYVAVQRNGTGSAPLQLKHGPPEGCDVQVNLFSKSKDIAGEDHKADARCFASPVNVSSEKVETEYKEDFCLTRDEVECPTCLEEYTDENPKITSKCNHHFHLGCIYEWMERSSTCPMCFEEMEFVEIIW